MPTEHLNDLMTGHQTLWQRFTAASANQRLAHAHLLIGPQHTGSLLFAQRMAAVLLCSQKTALCKQCKSCHLIELNTHPDLCYLEPEKAGAAIKIDQIRDLQAMIYTSPQLTPHRVVIINPAEKMNISAANALLKLLEEPPAHAFFILIAEQISTLLPTIISRSQQWQFSLTENMSQDYLSLGEKYQEDSGRGKLFGQLISMIQQLSDLLDKKISVCALAAKWSTEDIYDLLWLIYLINSQMICYRLTHKYDDKYWANPLFDLAFRLHPVILFRQLDQINVITEKLNHTISINQMLVLEDLLLGYIA